MTPDNPVNGYGEGMENYNFEEVKSCYNLTAQKYADLYANELDGKPFDRDFLKGFANQLHRESNVIEFGTGSGHVADFVYQNGLKNIIATDITENSLAIARLKFPHIQFEIDDMLASKFQDNSMDGIICFYGIVHFTYIEIEKALKEWKRILKKGGMAIFSFHIGNDESLRVNNFLDNPAASAAWNFFNVEKVVELMIKNDLRYDEVIMRYPYIGKEHESKRCYIKFTK